MAVLDMEFAGSEAKQVETSHLSVDLNHHCERWSEVADDELVVRAAQAAFARKAGELGDAELSIVLTDDAEIRALNSKWRGKDSATNVLSFPLDTPHGENAAVPLGDVVLALETIRREAGEKGISPRHHAAHLVIHGVLHLLGYDHTDDAEADEMEALETEIMLSISLPDPYASDDRIDGEPR